MKLLSIVLVFFLLGTVQVSGAQLNQADRFEILRVLIADNAAARIAMPLGDDGVRLYDDGVIDEENLQEELRDEGHSIEPGEVVEITDIGFGDDFIQLELNGGGEREGGFLSRIRVGFGTSGRTVPVREEGEPARGSLVVLRFAEQTPESMTVDEFRAFFAPVLDFNKQNFMDSGVESLPVEYQEAVAEKRAMIGMDRSTVTMARGRPNSRSWETNDEGIEEEIWIYDKVGFGADFLTFEEGILVRILRR
jgi:hypothetical protein